VRRVPKMHSDEVDVDESLVRQLVDAQFPQWAEFALQPVASTGTDNAIYRLGADMAVRLPRIHWAVPQVDKEFEWLPRLAAHLPVSVPAPLAKGTPARGYPFPWLICSWLDGQDLEHSPVPDIGQLARDVGGFVAALQAIDPAGGPTAGIRGRDLFSQDETTRTAIRRLEGVIDVDRAIAVWEAALEASPSVASPVWVHGDLLPGNIVVHGGRLHGIIDWSAVGLGDPACDAMVAWFFPPDARFVYRGALDLDDATWARARGWVVQQAALFIPYYAETIPHAVAAATRRLRAALSDDTSDDRAG
jgi:aminoglycoside phosphotransferase (APT) family kinase protein